MTDSCIMTDYDFKYIHCCKEWQYHDKVSLPKAV